MKWFAIIFIAIVVEAITEYVKTSFPKLSESGFTVFFTAILGVGVSIAYGADLLAVAGLTSAVPYLGSVLTGFIVARGSNYVYDFIGKFSESKSKAETLETMTPNEVEIISHEVEEVEANG